MTCWAILSGIEGNLAAYEAVLADIQQHRHAVSDLYILGDVIGLRGNNQAVLRRLQSPRVGEPELQICIGWWEEQCFSLHGLSGLPDAPELMAQFGGDGVQRLWKSVSREDVQWLRSLHFGFHELDCLLIHGSTVSYADELTPTTPPVTLCDRLIRADANTLFCGRSGLAFECQVEPTQLRSTVITLDVSQEPQEQGKTPRRVVGVGSVGRSPGHATYALYNPSTNAVTFKTIDYDASPNLHRPSTHSTPVL
ncbi:MAG: metallophosphatase [Thermosynechococcaceae cyanobacterium]